MIQNMRTCFMLVIVSFASFHPMTAMAAETLGTGTFIGKSNHVTTGSTQVIKNADGSHTVILGADFTFDGAPDPRVGFGNNGKYDKSTQLDHLQKNAGKQSYTVPAGIDPSQYNEVYIYCLKFNVPLGVAALK